ncbi:SixA phosphatase family protein [Marinicella sediminis]|uniref:SixA phosphatase family protein n=1 Tax=Marinicella sediminis TaxID=1792834 RepID=A0ABV7J9D3_9GAMM|nr:histidine phosphatase family protein [Marinicella sediminis]
MNLFVVRHGDSPFTTATDHQRPLSDLGIRQATQSGRFIATRIPASKSLIVCSDALRTTTTAHTIGEQLNSVEIKAQANLYGAQTGQWCDVMERHADIDNLILVGHNPTMSLLARHLFSLRAFQFQPACVAHFGLEIDADGLRLPAQYKEFFNPDAS